MAKNELNECCVCYGHGVVRCAFGHSIDKPKAYWIECACGLRTTVCDSYEEAVHIWNWLNRATEKYEKFLVKKQKAFDKIKEEIDKDEINKKKQIEKFSKKAINKKKKLVENVKDEVNKTSQLVEKSKDEFNKTRHLVEKSKDEFNKKNKIDKNIKVSEVNAIDKKPKRHRRTKAEMQALRALENVDKRK